MSSREREIKLAAAPAFRMPPLTDAGGDVFAGPDESLVLDATYYDTDDLRLARSGATLRHRSDQGWLVKLPVGIGNDVLARDEHNFAGAPNVPPAAALDLVRSLIRSAGVASVARLRTNRHRVPLHDADGKPIAEVVDDEVDVLDGPDDVTHFREIEVELTDTISDAQRSVVLARLRAAGAGVADPTPKLVQALGPRASALPDVVVEEVSEPTVDAVVRHSIGAAVAKLVAHDPGVRLGDDPEDVHQARVATRRLRSHLRTFSALIDEAWAHELRDELRWLGDVLGGVRDADVLLGRLESHVVRLPSPDRRAAERLLDTLRSDRDRRRAPLLEALRSDRYTSLLDALVRGAQRPRLLLRIDDEPDADVLRKLVAKPWTHLRDAVEALGDEPPDAELHTARIRIKRARYAAEAVEAAFGKPARAFARALTEAQDVLGEHQDAVVAAEWLRRTAAHENDESVGFAAGQLAAFEHVNALAARAAWPEAWKRASKGRLRDWL